MTPEQEDNANFMKQVKKAWNAQGLDANGKPLSDEPAGYARPCETCGGTGTRPFFSFISACDDCDGTGIHIEREDEAEQIPTLADFPVPAELRGDWKPVMQNRPNIQLFVELASLSNEELGAIDDRIIDYNTGKYIEGFDKDTALFIASARTIVDQLVRYIHQLEQASD